MNRYFFNFTGNPDDEGTEFADIAAAKRHGVICVGQLMRDDPRAFVAGEDIDLEITDERGLVLFVLNVYATNAPAAGAAS